MRPLTTVLLAFFPVIVVHATCCDIFVHGIIPRRILHTMASRSSVDMKAAATATATMKTKTKTKRKTTTKKKVNKNDNNNEVKKKMLQLKLQKNHPEYFFPQSVNNVLRVGEVIMNQVMRPAFFEQSSLHCLQRFYTQLVEQVHVKQSSIPGAGRGVFASKNIPKATIVGLYPVHKIICENNLSGYLKTWTNNNNKEPNNNNINEYVKEWVHSVYRVPENLGKIRKSLLDDIKKNEGNWNHLELILDTNDRQEIVKGWVAHLINDGSMVKEKNYDGLLQYWKESNSKKNVVVLPFGPSPILIAVTSKKVRKGEELFLSYGDHYWGFKKEFLTSTTEKEAWKKFLAEDGALASAIYHEVSNKQEMISSALFFEFTKMMRIANRT